jgi:Ser-tRNA(Ala) deacylase AlaX
MDTKQLYLSDSYVKTMEATILEVEAESAGKWKVVLDQSVFYPMGGGQPTDQGLLQTNDWQGKVYQCLNKEGTIIHYVEADSVPPPGTAVQGIIDWDRRYLNMRLHSAGHVIDFALYQLGYSPIQLLPLKADHGKKPVIWYQGEIKEDFQAMLQQKANELVHANLRFSIALVEFNALKEKTLYLQQNLPTNKPLRLLTLESVGSVADGGTQIARTAEVGTIEILPLEKKEGMTLIKYKVHP